jgi:hypothetical protein
MRHERILLILILSELVLIALGGVVEFALEPVAFGELHGAAPSRISAPFLTVLWAGVAAGTVASWIGLLYLLREARGLYLGSWAAYVVLTFLRGPSLEAPSGAVIQMLTALVGGAILGLIYFSELRTKFRPLAEASGHDSR